MMSTNFFSPLPSTFATHKAFSAINATAFDFTALAVGYGVVGVDVGIRVEVGGKGVDVGYMAWVMANEVHASAISVISAFAGPGLKVGADARPQAEMDRIINIERADRYFLYIFSPLKNISATKRFIGLNTYT